MGNASGERFLNSDQFTIYLPMNYDLKKVFQMCQEINELFFRIQQKEEVKKGKVSDVESPVNDFLVLRQEYLKADFKEGNVDKGKRINVVPRDDADKKEDDSVRKKVKKEQESSELFKSLIQSGKKQTTQLLLKEIDAANNFEDLAAVEKLIHRYSGFLKTEKNTGLIANVGHFLARHEEGQTATWQLIKSKFEEKKNLLIMQAPAQQGPA